jgi:DNA-binding IclR family transcriptional regulator
MSISSDNGLPACDGPSTGATYTSGVADDERSLPGRGYPRLLQLLELVADAEEPLTVGEVAQRLGIPKSTAWVLVQHLLVRGYVLEQGDDRGFVVGPSLYRLATAALHRHPIRPLARPFLAELREQIGADIYLAARSGDEVVYLDRLEGSHMLQIATPLSAPRPLHCTAAGKLMLALSTDGLWERFRERSPHLPASTRNTITELKALEREIRRTAQRGYGLSDGERYEGVFSIAAPVVEPDGGLVAAVVASEYAPTMRADLDRRVAAVCGTAARVSRAWATVATDDGPRRRTGAGTGTGVG